MALHFYKPESQRAWFPAGVVLQLEVSAQSSVVPVASQTGRGNVWVTRPEGWSSTRMLSEFWTEDEVDVGFAPSGVKRDLVVVLESKTGYREASAARIDRARREVCSDGSGLTHPIPSEQGASRPAVGPKKIGPHDAAAMLTCAVKTSGAAWLWELEKASGHACSSDQSSSVGTPGLSLHVCRKLAAVVEAQQVGDQRC